MKQSKLDFLKSSPDHRASIFQQTKTNKACSCNDATVLKLRLANQTSENLNLKRKIAQLQESSRVGKAFEIAFNNAIQVVRQLMRKQGKRSEEVDLSIAKMSDIQSFPRQSDTASTKQQNLTTRASNLQKPFESTVCKLAEWPQEQTEQPEQMKTIEGRQKVEEYEFLGRLLQHDSRETIKSLDFSLDSRSSLHSKSTQKEDKKYRQDLFQLKESYEQARQSLEAVYQMKIRLLNQELDEYKRQNEQLKKAHRTSPNSQEESDDLPYQANRQTAYFPRYCETICQESQEQSVPQSDFHSLSGNLRTLEGQKHAIMAQIKVIKEKLLKAYEFLKLKEDETMKVLETASSLRSQNKKIVVVSLDEYMELLESKKHQGISLGRCQALQRELDALKLIISKSN